MTIISVEDSYYVINRLAPKALFCRVVFNDQAMNDSHVFQHHHRTELIFYKHNYKNYSFDTFLRFKEYLLATCKPFLSRRELPSRQPPCRVNEPVTELIAS